MKSTQHLKLRHKKCYKTVSRIALISFFAEHAEQIVGKRSPYLYTKCLEIFSCIREQIA